MAPKTELLAGNLCKYSIQHTIQFAIINNCTQIAPDTTCIHAMVPKKGSTIAILDSSSLANTYMLVLDKERLGASVEILALEEDGLKGISTNTCGTNISSCSKMYNITGWSIPLLFIFSSPTEELHNFSRHSDCINN